jgi:hypothetical protein
MEKSPQIAFLLYANRSGSTFLASSLANVCHVGVSIRFFVLYIQ